VALALLIGFWLVALFFSYSRGAWIAGLAGMLSFLSIRYRFFPALTLFFTVLICAAFIYFSGSNRYLDYRPDFDRTIYHRDFREHLKATYRLTDLSTAERFYRWIAAYRMTDGHYLFGYGPNSFYPEYKAYTVTAFRTYVSDNPERSTVHNYFLLLLIEQGLPGLFIFIFLLITAFRKAGELYHRPGSAFRTIVAGAIAAILGMIIVLNLLSDLIETDKIGSIFFIALGMLAVLDYLFPENKPEETHDRTGNLPDPPALPGISA
jgi:O-antigen ligase